MTRYILDTDHVTLIQQGHPQITARAEEVGSDSIFVTAVTLEEQLAGRLAVINRAATRPQQLKLAYENLRKTHTYFCGVSLLGFDDGAATIYQQLRAQGIRVGSNDLRIGSIALANQMVVVTRNRKDFGQIPDLLLDDWTGLF